MVKISKEFTFDAAHKLYNPLWSDEKNKKVYGKCYNLHGHTYKLIITVEGVQDASGMLINFVDLKKIVQTVILDKVDHAYLNEVFPEDMITTCENMVNAFWNMLKDKVNIVEITLYETPTSWATTLKGE